MSTNRALGAGRRPGDYANIGYVGRKTGAVLRDTGVCDEYGMQSIDDLFSPPPRSEASFKTRTQVTGIPKETAEHNLNAVAASQRESSIYSSPRKSIPPRARSPIKTAIGSPRKSLNSSPAKTMALLASPVRMRSAMPTESSSQGKAEKEAFLNNKHKRRSLEQAPRRPTVAAAASFQKSIPQRAIRRSLFDIPSSPAINQEPAVRINGTKPIPSAPESPKQSAKPVRAAAPAVASTPFSLDDALHEDAYHSEEVDEDPSVATGKSALQGSNDRRALPVTNDAKRIATVNGKRHFNDIEAAERMSDEQPVAQTQIDEYEYQPDIGGFEDEEPDVDAGFEFLDDGAALDDLLDQEEEPLDISQPEQPLPFIKPSSQLQQANPSAPSLKRASPALDEGPEELSPPLKKQRIAVEKPVPLPSKERMSKTTAASKVIDKVPDAGTTKPKQRRTVKEAPLAQPLLPPLPYKQSRPKPRGLQIVRDSVEAEVDGARYTRSGRTSVKPVEYWRGERVIYTEPRREGGRVSLPGIKEVIRIEDEPRAAKPSKRKPGRPHKREPSVEPQDEPEQEWELEPGMFAGVVPSWDPDTQQGDPEDPEQVDLAIAPRGLSALSRPGPGLNYQFAKTVTLPFFHSGMIDLAPGGQKTTKNSRRNHMVFWVFSGRVVVDISGNQFSLGPGGMWQVPRGNSYSVSNLYEKPARIFFAQGCYMTEADGEAYEEAEAVGAAVQE